MHQSHHRRRSSFANERDEGISIRIGGSSDDNEKYEERSSWASEPSSEEQSLLPAPAGMKLPTGRLMVSSNISFTKILAVTAMVLFGVGAIVSYLGISEIPSYMQVEVKEPQSLQSPPLSHTIPPHLVPVTDTIIKGLQRPCQENHWRPGLWVNCTLSMGLNNLRSEFSTCLKYAYDAGAGIVIPQIALRDEKTLSAWQYYGEGAHYVPASEYFDVDYLKSAMSIACPQMKFKDTFDHSKLVATVTGPMDNWWEKRYGAGDYREQVDLQLFTHEVTKWTEHAGVVYQEISRPYSMWNYTTQSVEFGHAWFDSIQFARHIVSIGDRIASHSKLQHGYLGVHLRLEKDTLEGWAGFDAQTDAYAHYIDQRPERVIYLATGDPTWKVKFQERFPKHSVVDKWDLMEEGSELANEAHSLTFDERAILDYRAMLPANLVMGIGVSSFAYLLGVDRRADRSNHYAATLVPENMPRDATMLGDERTLLLPRILPEYYALFP